MNGAQALINTLVEGDVTVCFTNPGTSEMHFVAALDQVRGMRAVLGLFEGVCTGAADGYARMLGKPASTLLHLGPGLGNGFANCHDTAEAICAAKTDPGKIATLILPGDSSWNPTSKSLAKQMTPPALTFDETAVSQAVALLKSGEPTLLLLSGKAVLDKGLELVGQISVKTGCDLMSNRPTARRQQGAGRTVIKSLAYPVPLSVKQLAHYKNIILVSTAEPVAFFAYPNMPSRLAPDSANIHTLVTPEQDVVGALQALAEAVGVTGGEKTAVYTHEDHGLPTGKLNLGAIWQSVGAQLPEQAIVVNEAITSGWGAGRFLQNIAPFDMLTGTGGAIGHGLPQAVGAAVACPDRQVVGMQADGSAMYTISALWTQARENV